MKKSVIKTNAIRMLDSKKLNYNTYDYSATSALSGMEVAAALNKNPKQLFKTLVTIGKSGEHYVFLVPVDSELDLKKAANAVGEKNISMVKSKDLLDLTGYIHGGCSPIGMKKFFKTTIDESAKNFDVIIFSAGKIGYQIEMSIDELSKIISFQLSDIVEENGNEEQEDY